MAISGQFKSSNGTEYTVTISGTSVGTYTIEEGGSIVFTDTPVTIETLPDDTFVHIIKTSCTLQLLCRPWLGAQLFTTDARAITVEVSSQTECLFYGYLTANTFTQPYSNYYDQLTLNAVDYLSTLQYFKYKDVGTAGVDYNALKSVADLTTFRDAMMPMFEDIPSCSIYYDRSKARDGNSLPYNIFSQIKVSSTLFFDDDEDMCWTQEEVLFEILQYLNLHIRQMGRDFYIFSWESYTMNSTIPWNELKSASATQYYHPKTTWQLYDTNFGQTRVQYMGQTIMDTAETYNQIVITDDIKKVENVVTPPFDEDTISSPFSWRGLLCRDYITKDRDDMRALINGQVATKDTDAKIIDWYLRYYESKDWIINKNGTAFTVSRLKSGEAYDQIAIAKRCHDSPLDAKMFEISKRVTKATKTDNTISNSLESHKVIYIHTGRSRSNLNTTCMVYTGPSNGAVYSPMADNITNYLVFSGKLTLAPWIPLSGTDDLFGNMTDNSWASAYTWYNSTHGPTKIEDAHVGKRPYSQYGYKDDLSLNVDKFDTYYLRRFYDQQFSTSQPTAQPYMRSNLGPWEDHDGWKKYKYNHTDGSRDTDTVTKVAVLKCELKIGDKYCVEVDDNVFQWQTSPGVFSIGFNPSIGDCIVGQTYKFSNNIDYSMKLEDVEGTAIPIKRSDQLQGQVSFKVVGVDDIQWDNATYKHKTWFRSSAYNHTSHYIMADVDDVLIQDFEVGLYSDNGGALNEEHDVIFMSDENGESRNKKDDIVFRINTQLTAEEAQALNTTQAMNLSNTDIPTIENLRKEQVLKPEIDYIDSYYNEYASPKSICTIEVASGAWLKWQDKFQDSSLGKTFYVIGMTRDVKHETAKIKLKEI